MNDRTPSEANMLPTDSAKSSALSWREFASAGLRSYQAGQFSAARRALERALELCPDEPDILQMLGLVHLAQHEIAEAVSLLQRALGRKPKSPAILSNLGKAYFAHKKADQAIACYQEAIELSPDLAETHYNLGNAFYHIDRFDAAIGSYRRAISIRPSLAAAHYNLGNVYHAQRDMQKAEACYREAIRIKPDYLAAHINLGTALFSQEKTDAAIEIYRAALKLDPSDAEAYYSVANALVTQHKLDEAAALCRKGLEFEPNDPKLLSLYVHASRRMCLWEPGGEIEAAFIRASHKSDFDGSTFPLLSLVDDPRLHFVAARAYTANKLSRDAKTVRALRMPRRSKIRIAYCSADFGQHVMSHLFAGLFELHDREAFEVYGVSFSRDDGSTMRDRVLGAFDRVVDIRTLSDRAAADQIRDLGVDIAIDMKGYTQNHRAELFSHRIAPIQVNYVGYPGTMGAEFMDYILVDPFTVPSEQQVNYAERLVQLPNCYWINDIKITVAERTPSRSECRLPEDAFVFCSFSNSYKITPEVFEVWTRLLRAVPGSVLWLLGDNPWVEQNLRAEAGKRNIDPARLIFSDRVSLADHLARHRLADLGLDTFPYNGHTTVSDALWTGLPVVTLAGRSFAARVAGSMLLTVNLSELITQSLEDYEALALQLAVDKDRLSAVRAKLMKNKSGASLFDARRTTRDIEDAYRLMVKSMLAGEGPQPITVPARP